MAAPEEQMAQLALGGEGAGEAGGKAERKEKKPKEKKPKAEKVGVVVGDGGMGKDMGSSSNSTVGNWS